MALVQNALDLLMRQPSAALALQTYFDERKVRNRTASITADQTGALGAASLQSPHQSPPPLCPTNAPASSLKENTATKVSAVQDLPATESSFSASSFSVLLDDGSSFEVNEKTWPHLSAMISQEQQESSAAVQSSTLQHQQPRLLPAEADLPDLSALRMTSNINANAAAAEEDIPDLSFLRDSNNTTPLNRLDAVDAALAEASSLADGLTEFK